MIKTNVTVWNEFRHEKNDPLVRSVYPEGIHAAIAAGIAAEFAADQGPADACVA